MLSSVTTINRSTAHREQKSQMMASGFALRPTAQLCTFSMPHQMQTLEVRCTALEAGNASLTGGSMPWADYPLFLTL